MSDGLSEYWAFYTGAPALRVVLRKALKTQISGIKPVGKRKFIECIVLGKSSKITHPITPAVLESYLDAITDRQALKACKDLPLKDPEGCTWLELFTAYKERCK